MGWFLANQMFRIPDIHHLHGSKSSVKFVNTQHIKLERWPVGHKTQVLRITVCVKRNTHLIPNFGNEVYITCFLIRWFCLILTGSQCDSSWSAHGGHCYLYINAGYSYAQAVKQCHDRGGYITELQSHSELQFVNGMKTIVWIAFHTKTVFAYTMLIPGMPQSDS